MNADLIFQLKDFTRKHMQCHKNLSPSPNEPVDMSLVGNHDIEINTHEYAANSAGFHKHKFFEMNYVLYGTCIQNLDNQETVNLQRGNFCILNPNAWHSCKISSPNDVVINFMIKPNLFNSTFFSFISDHSMIGHFLLSYLRSDVVGDCNYMLFTHSYSSYVDEIISHILQEYISDRIYSHINIRCLLILLFSEILYDSTDRNVEDSSTISEILTYIAHHLDTVTLKHTAEHFYMNPNYLSAYIKKQTGSNYSQIVSNLRVNEAKKMLASSDISPADISTMLGYKDPLSFHNMFKNKTGMTPTQYRLSNT